jgi:hypothetical protein
MTQNTQINLILQGEEFAVEKDLLLEIPYFNSLLKGDFKIEMIDSKIVVKEIKKVHLVIILKALQKLNGLQNNFFYLYSGLKKEEDILSLFETVDFLGLDPPKDEMNIDEISEKIRIKNGYFEEDEEYKHRKTGRITAASLGWAIFKQMFDVNDLKFRNQLYQITLFVVSHPRTYKQRFRFHFHEIVKNCGVLSEKQWKTIDKWEFDDCAGDESLSDHSYEHFYGDSDGYSSYGSD